MILKKIYLGMYSLFITNYYGFKLKNSTLEKKKKIRIEYAEKILNKLNIKIEIKNNLENKIKEQYIVIVNHTSVLDPLIIEIVLKKYNIKGYWIAKEELSKSIFFGLFVNNAGTIQINRDKTDIKKLFKETSEKIKEEKASIFIFPEGNRNKTTKKLQDFKTGANIIARKNKLNILPIYIETNVSNTLKNSLKNNEEQIIKVNIGGEINYTEKDIEKKYIAIFNIEN